MLRIVSLLFIFSLSPVIARADTVTSGTFSFGGAFNSLTERLQFGGPGFSVNALASTQFGISLPAMFTCIPCTSGTSVSLSSSAFLVVGDFAFGTVTVNGVSRSISTSSMSFSAGTVIVPVTTDPIITLTAPFTLTSGSANGGGVGVSFTGVGNASLSLARFGTDASGNSLYRFNGLTYTFGNPIPDIPEPASMLLLLTGVLALPAMFRKRKL